MKKTNFQLISYGLIFLGSSFLSLDLYADICDKDADCTRYNTTCSPSNITCKKSDGTTGKKAYTYTYFCQNDADENSSCKTDLSHMKDCGCK